MMRRMLAGKIHRAIVTEANLDYEGSVGIDSALMKAAGIFDGEAVSIWNVTRGSRLTTYAIEGPAGSGTVAVNGAAAHLNQPGDVVILACFAYLSESEAGFYRPRVVFVDQNNNIVERRAERLGISV